MLFGYCFRTPCLLVRRHVRRSASSCPARSRTPMRSLQSRHAPLALAPRMVVSRRALPPFVWKKHCPPLGGTVCGLQCSHSYDTAIRRYPPVWKWIFSAWIIRLPVRLRKLHFACDPQVAILQAHCMTPQGTVVHLLSHSPCDLTEYAQWSRADSSRAAILPTSRSQDPASERNEDLLALLVQ